MASDTTIAAIATGQGAGGIAVIRISGPEALSVLKKCFSHKGKYESHRMVHGWVLDGRGTRLDEAMAVFMKAPRSYTAEDTAEIQCHGGTVAAERTLRAVLNAGAAPAQPGEFTKRAFLNGRIDLAQAEAVMQLVSAKSEAAARAGLRQLTGGVSARVREILDKLTDAQALIEASDDFPDEIDEEAGSDDLRKRLKDIREKIGGLCDPRSARIITRGSSVVLTGRPNVGKSSLLNRLVGAQRAIVTQVPGTTRDAITVHVEMEGVDVELTDTAGLRDTADEVEKIGVRRAEEAARQADLLLMVLDASEEMSADDDSLLKQADGRCAAVLNKRDIGGRIDPDLIKTHYNIPVLEVSAETGEGVEELKNFISSRIRPAEPPLVAQRHMDAARQAGSALEDAIRALDAGYPMDVCAMDISRALESLGQITGQNVRESVIDQIFRQFCVGK